MVNYAWLVIIIILIGREIYLGYKYGVNEPLQSKKSLQRGIKWLFFICILCMVLVKILLPYKESEEIVYGYTNEELVEITQFSKTFSLANYEYYQDLYLQKEIEVEIDNSKPIDVSIELHRVIPGGQFYLVEDKELTNTMKVKILEAPYIDGFKDLKILTKFNLELELFRENNFIVHIGRNQERPKVNIIEDEFFKHHPWITGNHTFYYEGAMAGIIIVFELPPEANFREAFQYLK